MTDAKSTTCPTCAELLVFPSNLLDAKHKDLLVFLIRMLDCEVETYRGIFNICFNCERLLNSFLEFKLFCEKSIEKFRNIPSEEDDKEILFFVKDSNLESDISEAAPSESDDSNESTSEIKTKNIPKKKVSSKKKQSPKRNLKRKDSSPAKSDSLLQKRKSASTSKDLSTVATKPQKRKCVSKSPQFTASPKIKQRFAKESITISPRIGLTNHGSRLKRYSPEVCAKAYKECMKSFYLIRQCPICLICMSNRHRLGTHITKLHSEFKDKWCRKCNTIEINIAKHNAAKHKDVRLFTCPLCKRCLSNGTDTRMHIERHSITNVKLKPKADWQICYHCPSIFATSKELGEHQCSNPPEDSDMNDMNEMKYLPQEETLDVAEAIISEEVDPVIQNVEEKTENRRRPYRRRFEIFPHDEVDRALRETMTEFYTNRQCPICGFITVNLKLLRTHVLASAHKDMRGKWCRKCNILVDNLEEHNDIHPDEFYYCPFCHKDFDDRYKYKLHLTHHSDTHFATTKTVWSLCNHCPKSFPYEDELKQHYKEHHPELDYDGGRISEKLADKSVSNDVENARKGKVVKRTNKIRQMKAPLVRSCPICKAQIKYLSMHIKKVHMHASKAKRKGIAAKKDVITADKLKRNEKAMEVEVSQENEKSVVDSEGIKIKDVYLEQRDRKNNKMGRPRSEKIADYYLCNYCGYKARNVTRLKFHMITHTGEKPYECSFCGKCFNKVESRNGHELRHVGEKRFSCDVCGKMYVSKNEVRMHRKMHVTEPQECYICKKQFCRPQLLKLHMRKHTESDKYPCTQCPAKFHLNRLLTRHIIDMHTTDRPYKCSYCTKDFKYVEHLNSHERIHKGIKPYSCSCCTFVTSTSYSLTLHMKRHPEDAPQASKPHKCQYCFKSYTTKAMLMSHKRNVHKNIAAIEEVVGEQNLLLSNESKIQQEDLTMKYEKQQEDSWDY